MEREITINVDAAPEVVWAVMIDVERWPTWTASMRRVERLDEGPFVPGCRVRISQPRLPPVTWQVSDVVPGRCFTWVASTPGLTSTAEHHVAPTPDGASTVTLRLQQRGLLAPALRAVTSGLTERYLRLEAEGLKRESESR
jgi:uncharacterized membrane protein